MYRYTTPKAIIVVVATLTATVCLVCHNLSAQQLDSFFKQKPFSIGGSFGVNLIGYHASGIENRTKPFTAVAFAQANAKLYGISIPFSFQYSGKKAEFGQPFNQFGLSPQYKWLTLHGGYRTIRFSDFTLAGHNFLGGGVEMNPGKFRFGFVYGRFRDQSREISYSEDTLSNYTRRGFALKLGSGTSQNFIDFLLLRIQDDSTSLPATSGEKVTNAEQNLVIGLNSRKTLGKRFSFEAEVTGSLYTSDLSAPGFEQVEEIPIWATNNLFYTANLATELTTAIRTSLLFKEKNFSSKLEFRRIDPGYKSMGAYYFATDIEQIAFSPTLSLLKRKLLLRGSIGVQRDNLRRIKKATSVRAISSANISFNPIPVFGIDLNYSNYSNTQRRGILPLIDSLKQFHTTANFSIMPRLFLIRPKYQHMIILMVSNMQFTDHNEWNQGIANNSAFLANLNYNLDIVEHSISVQGGLNFNKLNSSAMSMSASGITAGVSKSFFDSKLSTGLSNTLVVNHSGAKGHTFNTAFQAGCHINRHHNFRLNFYFINNVTKDNSIGPSFNETKGDFGYVYTF